MERYESKLEEQLEFDFVREDKKDSCRENSVIGCSICIAAYFGFVFACLENVKPSWYESIKAVFDKWSDIPYNCLFV